MPVGSRPRRLLAGIVRSGLGAEDAVRAACDLVAGGLAVDLELRGSDVGRRLADLSRRLEAAGIVSACETTVPVTRFVPAMGAGPALALDGPAAEVDRVAAVLPSARVVVDASEPGAEDRCRVLAGRRVRLVGGRGRAASLSFVRCLTILMSGDGEPAVATTDPRLIAVTGERAAWNGRPPESWEHVMPWGPPTEEQRRLLAAGSTVRVRVPVSGVRA